MIVRASAMRYAPTIFVKRVRGGGQEKEKETGRTTQRGDCFKSRCISCFQTRRLIIIISLSIRYQECDRRLRSDLHFCANQRVRCGNTRLLTRHVRASGREFSSPVLFPEYALVSDARIIRNRWI